MDIAVLVKQVPDTWSRRALDPSSGRVIRDPRDAVLDEIDEVAVEVALAAAAASKGRVVLVAMGPDQATDAVRRGLAMGADEAVLVADPALAGADMLTTARVLAEVVRREGCDLVVAGDESTDGRGGVIPAMVAELLGRPHATFLDRIEVGDSIRATRAADDATVELEVGLPAVVSVTERAAEPRLPGLKGTLRARKAPVRIFTAAELGVPVASPVVLVDAVERPPRTGGRVVADDEAVSAFVDFLAEHKAI